MDDTQEIISKIKNMYIMLLYAITKEDINRVRQYLTDGLATHYEEKIKYKKLEYKVINYSKAVKVTSKGSINLGSSVAGYYGLSSDGKVIIEKCNDCIRLWHPNMFNIYYDNLANNGKRRK